MRLVQHMLVCVLMFEFIGVEEIPPLFAGEFIFCVFNGGNSEMVGVVR